MPHLNQTNTANKRTFYSLILAVLGVFGLAISYNSSFEGIVLLPIFYITFVGYNTMPQKKINLYILSGMLSIIYAITLILGVQLDIQSEILFSLKTLIRILLLSLEIFPFLAHFIIKTETYTFSQDSNCKFFRLCLFMIIISWILAYLALFPGVYATDAPYWYHEFYRSDINISSQWSPVYCGLFYLFMRVGKNLSDDFSIGFALFTFIQMSFSIYVIWKILSFINTHLNIKFVIAATLFFMLPTHVILALTSAQDSVFTACFAMSLLLLLEYCLNEENFTTSKNKMIKLFFWMALMCIARNNGLYAILILLAFALFLKAKKKLLILLIGTIATTLIYQGPVYNLCGIQKGTAIREILSLPLQQMAYVYNKDNLSQQEKSEMEKFVSEEGWKMYTSCISDPVKSNLNIEAFQKNKDSFFKLYSTCFFKHPREYLQATGLQTFILWYPNKIWPDARPWHPFLDILCYDESIGYEPEFSIVRKSLFPQYEILLEKMFGFGAPGDGYGGNLDMFFSKIPIIGALFQAGTYTWTLLYIVFYSAYKKNRKLFLIMSFILGVWFTVFLSPVIMYRYCAPFIFTAPLYISALLILREQ